MEVTPDEAIAKLHGADPGMSDLQLADDDCEAIVPNIPPWAPVHLQHGLGGMQEWEDLQDTICRQQIAQLALMCGMLTWGFVRKLQKY